MSYAEILKDLPKSCLAVAEKRCAKKDYDIKVEGNALITEIYTKVRQTYLEKRARAKMHARKKRELIASLNIDTSAPTSPIEIV
jgi:hypothetical protein